MNRFIQRPPPGRAEPKRATACRAAAKAALFLILLSCPFGRATDAAELKLVQPTRGEIHRYVTLPGNIKANQEATLFAKVSGYLKSLAVDKGDAVEAGQSLGEIEVPELEADLARHSAELKVATIDLERVSQAQRRAPDLVVPKSIDDARGRVEIAQANIDRIQTLLRYAKLTAPFSGIITARYADPGAFIPSPTSTSASAGAGIVTLMDFSTVRVQAPTPEIEAALVRAGQPVKFTVEALPGKTFSGEVSRHAYALDEATKTMLVEADVKNPDLALRPGMYAIVRIGVESRRDALVIPAEALVREKSGAYVWVAANGVARKQPVKVGITNAEQVQVLEGLDESHTVILPGGARLAEGATITGTKAP